MGNLDAGLHQQGVFLEKSNSHCESQFMQEKLYSNKIMQTLPYTFY